MSNYKAQNSPPQSRRFLNIPSSTNLNTWAQAFRNRNVVM